MSGAVLVLAGALSGPAGWAVIGAIGAFRAGQLASEWLRHERALAERKMQKEKQAAEAWQRHHRARQEAIRRATEQREAVRWQLAGLQPCPACGGALRIVACIEDPAVIKKVPSLGP